MSEGPWSKSGAVFSELGKPVENPCYFIGKQPPNWENLRERTVFSTKPATIFHSARRPGNPTADGRFRRPAPSFSTFPNALLILF